MVELTKALWRKIRLPVAVAVGGAMLGTAAVPMTARAATAEVSGWTCYQTDKCHSGTAACCDDTSFDHCTTMCEPE